jgi:hypothetical protein
VGVVEAEAGAKAVVVEVLDGFGRVRVLVDVLVAVLVSELMLLTDEELVRDKGMRGMRVAVVDEVVDCVEEPDLEEVDVELSESAEVEDAEADDVLEAADERLADEEMDGEELAEAERVLVKLCVALLRVGRTEAVFVPRPERLEQKVPEDESSPDWDAKGEEDTETLAEPELLPVTDSEALSEALALGEAEIEAEVDIDALGVYDGMITLLLVTDTLRVARMLPDNADALGSEADMVGVEVRTVVRLTEADMVDVEVSTPVRLTVPELERDTIDEDAETVDVLLGVEASEKEWLAVMEADPVTL